MNVHDSERLAGLLEVPGYIKADADELADVVVFNTCAVRENADNKLYGNLGQLTSVEAAASPACRSPSAAASRRRTAARSSGRAPWVDVVFGTHNVGSLPVLLERARIAEEAQVEILESLEVFPSTLPVATRVGLCGMGRDQRRMQQHLHVLHRAEPARDREGPAARRHSAGDRDAGRRGCHRGHAARPERELLRRRVRRPRWRSRSCCAPAAPSTASSACGSPRRIRATSPTT